jgi:aspartate/methionine/tyrosine aminotransferase
MQYRPEVLGVLPSPLLAIGALAESMPGAIKLCYGESDLPTPRFISRASYEASLAGHTYYTTTAGYLELRQAIAEKIEALHGIEYRPTEIMSTVGATMGIYAAVRAVVGAGDNAVVVSPSYSLFVNAITLTGAEPREVPLTHTDSGYALDLDRVRAAVDARTRLIVVNSPNNPTGWIISGEEQRTLCALAAEHDLVILSDEVYERIVYDRAIARSFAWAAQEAGVRDRVIVVNSFSKTYNMTGWRLGWVQASERTIQLMAGAAEFMTSNAASMIQQAGIVALREGESFVHDLRSAYAARRAQAIDALSAMPRISVSAPAGAFFAFARVDGVDDSTDFAESLLRSSAVALTPGSAFGAGGEGHLRLCFASTESTLTEALARLANFFCD